MREEWLLAPILFDIVDELGRRTQGASTVYG